MPHPILHADFSISPQPTAYQPPGIPVCQPQPVSVTLPEERCTIYSGATEGHQRTGLYQAIMGHSTLPSPKTFVFTSESPPPRLRPVTVEDGQLDLDPHGTVMGQLSNPVWAQRVSTGHAIWPRAVRNTALRIVSHESEPEASRRHWCLKYFASPRLL